MNDEITTKKIELPPKIKRAKLARIMGVSAGTIARRVARYGVKLTQDKMITAADARRILTE